MSRSKIWLALGAVVLAACSSTAKGVSSTTSEVTPTASTVAANPSPAASPTPSGWITYNEPAWGYRLSMPGDWHPVPAGETTPAQFRHFSSENVTNVATLSGLDSNGMMLTVIVSPANSGCPGTQPPVGWSESTVPAVAINIDGYTSVVSGHQAQDLSNWGVQASAAKGKYCYSFVGLTLNHAAQLKWAPVFEQMLVTFSFGTPISPPF